MEVEMKKEVEETEVLINFRLTIMDFGVVIGGRAVIII